jgi:hypothetical protein
MPSPSTSSGRPSQTIGQGQAEQGGLRHSGTYALDEVSQDPYLARRRELTPELAWHHADGDDEISHGRPPRLGQLVASRCVRRLRCH